MEPHNNERIAKLEEQSKGHTEHYDRLYEATLRMEGKLDALTMNFLPRAEAQEMFRSRDEDIKEIRDELREQRNDSRNSKATLPAWFAVGISIVVAVLTLITLFL
ncbi:hypothetical protein Q9251_03090 [Alkalihalobacillus macyae]|uniref:hypothetical protein n=1 Tax=Guptibacillus hwajinpoensis TaxID=208199 RepID=UPI00273C3E92|nr:hypothetical protein [Alkalihalobacillus macyae]MDP4549861.1 hypothetical protein [Alkalihalobacillus macyae]